MIMVVTLLTMMLVCGNDNGGYDCVANDDCCLW